MVYPSYLDQSKLYLASRGRSRNRPVARGRSRHRPVAWGRYHTARRCLSLRPVPVLLVSQHRAPKPIRNG